MKRGDSYSVRYKYKDHSGKPCEGWESFKTRKEAQERKITVEKELLDGTFLVPDTMTVEEMLYKWIPIQSTKHKWSPKTYTQSVAMVQNLIVPYIGKRKVQELRTYDIEKFYATLAKTPCGQHVHGVKQTLTDRSVRAKFSACSRVIWISMPPMGVAPSQSARPCSEPTRTLWKSSTPIRSTTPSRTGVRAASPLSS